MSKFFEQNGVTLAGLLGGVFVFFQLPDVDATTATEIVVGAGAVARLVQSVRRKWLAQAAALLLATSCSGPGKIQRGLSLGATMTAELSTQAATFIEDQDALCRRLHPPLGLPVTTSSAALERAADFYQCMEPVEAAYPAIQTGTFALDRALRTAQAAYDAAGEDGFRDRAPCIVEAATQLGDGLSRFIPIPQEFFDLLELARSFAAPGQEC